MSSVLPEPSDPSPRPNFHENAFPSSENWDVSSALAELNQDLRDRQLRIFFEEALDAMVICDDAGRYLDANPAACELFGLSRQELLGQSISQFVQGDNVADIWHQFQDEERLTGELQIRRADGTVRDVEFAATANFLPHRHLSVLRDITRRKELERSLQQLNQDLEQRVEDRTAELLQTNRQLQYEIHERQQVEQALRQSRAKLGDILDRAIACIMSFRVFQDRDWAYDYYSAGCQELFGFSTADIMVDKHLWLSRVHSEDVATAVAKMYDDIFAERTSQVEYRFHHPDDSLRWILASYTSRYDAEADCWIVTCVCTDISDRKHAEAELQVSQQRLSFALESARAGIWYWDMATNKTYWSETNYRLMGYEPGDYDTTFDRWLGAIHPDDRGWVLERIERTLEQRSKIHMDYRVQLRDGGIRWLRDLGRVILDDDGNPCAMTGIQIDITETQLVKEALQQSEARLSEEIALHRENENRFQLALEGSGDGLWDWTIDTGRVLFDQRWLAMLGYGAGELPEHVSTWEDLIHPEDKPQVMAELEAHLQDQDHTYKFEYRLRTKTGHWKWVANYGKVIARDAEGNPLRMVGTHRDIDRRKRREQALRYQKALLDSLFETTPDLIAVLDPDFRFLSFNYAYQQEFRKIFGAQIQIGTHIGDALAHLPEEQTRAMEIWGRALAGEEFTIVKEFGDDLRERKIYEITFTTVRDEVGTPLGAAAFLRDVSDRIRAQAALQESEERFRNAFDYAGIGKVIVGKDGEFLKVNRAYCQITGYSQDELLALDFQTITHPDDLNADLALVDQLARGEIESYQLEKRYIHKQGHVVWVLLTGSAVRDADNQLKYFIGQIQDITDRLAATAQLQQSQALLKEAQRVAHIGNWSFDVKTKAVIWSEETYHIFGFDPDQAPITLDQHTSLIHPEDRHHWQATVDQAIAQKRGYVLEFRAIRPDQSICTVEARGEVELDHQGEIVRLFGTVQDVSERRYLEDTLRSQIQKETALSRVLQVIRQSLELADIFAATVEEIGHLTQAKRVEIVQYFPNSKHWRNVADYRCSEDLPSTLGMEFPDEGNAIAAQLKQMEIVKIEDATQVDDAVNPGLAEQFAGSWLLVPIQNASSLWGALSLVKEPLVTWPDSDVELLQAIADQLAVAIVQVTLYQRLQRELNSRQQMEQVLRHSAMHDALTDLPNRNLLISGLEFALKRLRRQRDFQFAVLFLDLDRFKLVNDSLGHIAGDQLLKAVAHRILEIVRPTDIAARLGGDEFVILLDTINSLTDATLVAERLLTVLRQPFQVLNRKIYISASIGIVGSVQGYRKAADILRDADIAMYQAKSRGKNCYALFDPGYHDNAMRQLQLEHDLRSAIALEQFLLYYQPIVNLADGTILGFEALVRWQHPHLGLVPPDEFISLAEETGLITELGDWILRTACHQLQAWRQQFSHHSKLKINVNLSVEQLKSEHFAGDVEQILKATGLEGDYLTLEITETMLINDTEGMIELLEHLHTFNVKVAIDDFGTGYSSLSYLHRLPIDSLKIDKSFIQQMNQDQVNHSIVETIVTLSDQLDLLAVAEGIEIADHLTLLKSIGCEQGQGYYFSHPLPTAEVTALLKRGLSIPGSRL
jgi:diguanylate cyclase (GGDEF)-like protein/PAS domain S-box-containing protein